MSKISSIILVAILGIIVGFLVYFFYPSPGVDNRVNIYFSNNLDDPESFNCGEVYPVKRIIQDEQNIPFMTVSELLNGPSEGEIKDGFFTNINPGVEINKLVFEEGVVIVDLSSELTDSIGGSCLIMGIEAQITETLLQFEEVDGVTILIEGEEEVLQP
jgi:spore germination protein GerM